MRIRQHRNFKRRASVSAEVFAAQHAMDFEPVYHEKELDEYETITQILQSTMLFRHLNDQQLATVVDSMYKCEFQPNEVVIQQGNNI